MKTWLVKDARARLSEVMNAALSGEPQRIARRGREAVVMVSESEWAKVRAEERPTDAFVEALIQFPLTHEEWLEVAPGPFRHGQSPFSATSSVLR